LFGIAFALGQGGAPSGSSSGGGLMGLLPIIIMFVIIYLLLILPQQKQQKKHKEMLNTLQKGVDEQRNIVVLKIDENVKIEVQKSTVASKIENK